MSYYDYMRKGTQGMIKDWKDWDAVFNEADKVNNVIDEAIEDLIEKPQHYRQGNIEAIDYMRDSMNHMMFMGYLEGAVKKYLHRYRYKSKPVEDLKKAQWYLTKLIDEMEGGGS